MSHPCYDTRSGSLCTHENVFAFLHGAPFARDALDAFDACAVAVLDTGVEETAGSTGGSCGSGASGAMEVPRRSGALEAAKAGTGEALSVLRPRESPPLSAAEGTPSGRWTASLGAGLREADEETCREQTTGYSKASVDTI